MARDAARLGVHEYLRKPVSAQALLDRLTLILAKPRAIVQRGDYYGPEPRRDFPDPVRSSAVPGRPDGTSLN